MHKPLVVLLERYIDGIRPSCGRCRADHPAFIFQVVGQSRDDVPTVVQAGGHHPGSQFYRLYLALCIWTDVMCGAELHFAGQPLASFAS